MTTSESSAAPYSESRVTESLQGFSQSQARIEEQVSLLFTAYRNIYDRLALEFPLAYETHKVTRVNLGERTVTLANDTVITFDELFDIEHAAALRRTEMEEEILRRMHRRETLELEELEARIGESGLNESGMVTKVARLLELRQRYPHVEEAPRPLIEVDTSHDATSAD